MTTHINTKHGNGLENKLLKTFIIFSPSR